MWWKKRPLRNHRIANFTLLEKIALFSVLWKIFLWCTEYGREPEIWARGDSKDSQHIINNQTKKWFFCRRKYITNNMILRHNKFLCEKGKTNCMELPGYKYKRYFPCLESFTKRMFKITFKQLWCWIVLLLNVEPKMHLSSLRFSPWTNKKYSTKSNNAQDFDCWLMYLFC